MFDTGRSIAEFDDGAVTERIWRPCQIRRV